MQEEGPTGRQKAKTFFIILAPFIISVVAVELTLPPLWYFVISGAGLVCVGILALFLWRLSPTQETASFWQGTGLGALFFWVFGSILMFLYALAQALGLQQLGLDRYSASLLVMMLTASIVFLLITLLSRKWRSRLQTTDENELPLEVQEVWQRVKEYWGMTSQAVLRQGIIPAGVVILLACFALVAGTLGAVYRGAPRKLGDWVFLLLFAGMVAGGGFMLYSGLQVLRRSLRFWRQWRNQPEERLIIQGKIVGFWLDEGDGYTAIIKVQRSNGISKLLLVNADLVPDDENAEVCIEYLYGTEAVVKVETLLPSAEAEETP